MTDFDLKFKKKNEFKKFFFKIVAASGRCAPKTAKIDFPPVPTEYAAFSLRDTFARAAGLRLTAA